MFIVFLSVCFWYKEAVGHIIITLGQKTAYSTPYDTHYDTYNEGPIYGDESYYYNDEPVTTEMFTKQNTDQFKFGLKGKTYINAGGHTEADWLQNVNVESSNVISQSNEGNTRAHHIIDKSVSGSIGHTRHTGMNFLDGAKTNSGPVFHTTGELFRNGNKDYTLNLHQSELRNIYKERLRGPHTVIGDHSNVKAKSSSTKSPINIQFREKQHISLDKGRPRSITIITKGTESTTQSPVVVDVTESPAIQTVRQETLKESEPIVHNRQNATDQVDNLSSNRRFGIPITSEGRSCVRGLMLSVLRRAERFNDGSERRPVRF